MDYPIEETIRLRRSVRTYDVRPLSQEDRAAVEGLLARMQDGTPFPGRITASLLEAGRGTDAEKLGTYGVIRGAASFIGVAVRDAPGAMEALGYSFEKVVLGATALGLGTCWLAGIFNRGQFEGAMVLAADDIIPIVCPIGYPSGRESVVNSLFRRTSDSDHRKPFGELFFDGAFGKSLAPEAAGADALFREIPFHGLPDALDLSFDKGVYDDGASVIAHSMPLIALADDYVSLPVACEGRLVHRMLVREDDDGEVVAAFVETMLGIASRADMRLYWT